LQEITEIARRTKKAPKQVPFDCATCKTVL